MSEITFRCRCGGEIIYEPMDDVPPPPMPILSTAMDPPDQWKCWIWRCRSCGAQMVVTYDWGTLDLGMVRDSDLNTDNDFEVFEQP